MNPFQLSPPEIAQPLNGTGKAVVASGCLAGARVTIKRQDPATGNWNDIGHGIYPQGNFLLNIEVAQLRSGDLIWAVQEYQFPGGQTVRSQMPTKNASGYIPRVGAQPRPLREPSVRTPLYTCGRKVVVCNIENGALVELYINGVKTQWGYFGFPSVEFSVPPLQAQDSIYAIQSMPDVFPAKSQTVTPRAYPERQLPKPTIVKPLIQCAPSFQVSGLVPGALLRIYEDKQGLLHEKAIAQPTECVEVADGLQRDWVLSAEQELCSPQDTSPRSDPVLVEIVGHLKNYPPQWLRSPNWMNSNFWISVMGVHESTIRIELGPDASHLATVGGGTCTAPVTTFRLDDPLPYTGLLRLTQSLECPEREWEVSSLPRWTGQESKTTDVTDSIFNAWMQAQLPIMIEFYQKWDFVPTIAQMEQLANDYDGRALIGRADRGSFHPPSLTFPDSPTFVFYQKNGAKDWELAQWDETAIRTELDKLVGP